MPHLRFALSLAAALCAGAALSAGPASAGDRHAFAAGVATYHLGDHRGPLRPLYYPRPHVHLLPGHNGPQLYYGYHHDHIPAYPVPIFRSYHAPVVHHHTVVVAPASAHVAWCHARYRSYRVSDNSFQPYHGPRKQCWSPYS